MDLYDDITNASSSTSSSSIGYPSNMLEEQHHVEDDDSDDEDVSSCVTNDNMFELSDLMSQLPIKKGLSKYYNGKSDSFKNLLTLKSLEDVPKNISHRIKNKKKNMKIENNKKYSFTTPKSKISKTNNINNNNKKGSMKGSILMNTWNVTSTSGLNNSSTNRFIHV